MSVQSVVLVSQPGKLGIRFRNRDSRISRMKQAENWQVAWYRLGAYKNALYVALSASQVLSACRVFFAK